jgi:hypothetical protein
MTVYVQRAIAFLLATLAVVFPVFGFAPRLYAWLIQYRLRRLYQRLRVIENTLQTKLTAPEAEALETELNDIDKATMSVPLRHSHLYFTLRYHLDRTRSRLIERAGGHSPYGAQVNRRKSG